MNRLAIWMNGELVGWWSRSRAGTHTLTYAPEWQRSPRRRSLSLSLPMTSHGVLRGPAVESYFDNLLPDDSNLRERLRRRYGLKSASAMDLLSQVGRDCVGAVQLLPPDRLPEGVRQVQARRLTADQVGRHIDRMLSGRSGPGMGAVDDDDDEVDDFRISIAGAQEKTALLKIKGRWYLPRGSTPTTHILKLPLGMVGNRRLDLTTSVENEWLCLSLLGRIGLPVASAEIGTFGQHKALVVERFDREWKDGATWLARLPQEDLCQATGTSSGNKYESNGGPGIDRCLRLLAGSSDENDGAIFLLTQVAFWMLGATDGHAKNFSIFLSARDAYQLTPLYDVLSAWPAMGPGHNQIPRQKLKLAMSVRLKNAHSNIDRILPRHWLQLCAGHRHAGADAIALLAQNTLRALDGMGNALPADFPLSVWDPIYANTRAKATSLLT